MGSMYPVFQLLSASVGERLGWYLGLVVYWIFWGGLFSWFLLGPETIFRIIKPQRINLSLLVLVIVPIILAGIFKFITGSNYEKSDFWVALMLVSTTIGNGFFEELLWRGVYMVQFPLNLFFRIVWASVWFGLWHYVPGTVSSNSNAAGLIIGSTLFGFYLSYLANRTGTIWWSIVAHVLGGLVMVL